MSGNKAFSLIELMVVIAIVAILAAVALPAYKNYVMASNLSAVGNIVRSIMEKSKMFATTHGRFAQGIDLGLGGDGSNWTVDDTLAAPLFGKYFNVATSYLLVGDYDVPYACGRMGNVEVTLDPVAFGLHTGDELYLGCDFWHSSGVIYSYCYYVYSYNGVYSSEEILPKWHNLNDPNSDKTSAPGYNSMSCI